MLIVDVLVAWVIALILSGIFILGFRNRGPWGQWWIFSLIVFLGAWLGALWVTPFGPSIYGTFWLPMLFVGLIFALMMAAAVPGRSRQRSESLEKMRSEASVEARRTEVMSVFVWALLLILVIVIVVAYF